LDGLDIAFVELEGIVLRQPLKKSHILMDWQVVKFLTRLQYAKAEQQCSQSDKLEMIRSAIREKKNLEILYLKAKDEKSRRTIRPVSVGEMEYNGHPFVGMNAWCLIRKEKRVFNVDRILEIGWPEES
jgi:predicted DNA-binding transcriptional regulator YafY